MCFSSFTHMCICSHMHVQVCAWMSSSVALTLFFEVRYIIEPGPHQLSQTNSPSHSSHYFPVTLWLRMILYAISLFFVSMPIDIGIVWVSFIYHFKKGSLKGDFLVIWLLEIFCPVIGRFTHVITHGNLNITMR